MLHNRVAGLAFLFKGVLTITTACAAAPLAWAEPTNYELLKLTAFDAAAGDQYGNSLAIDSNVIIIGSDYDDDVGLQSGSAYLYNATKCEPLYKLVASDAVAGDRFGSSVAISGNKAIVGAPLQDHAGSGSGAAYVFDVQTGQEIVRLSASDAAPGDVFGQVAISGNIAVVGASQDDDGGSNSGSAYVFDAQTGQQLFKLTPSDAATGDRFGHAVAIDGSIAVIGAYRDDHTSIDAGSAYVFDVTTGQQLFKLAASDAASADWFGLSVAISGDTIIVGSDQDDDGDARERANTGSAYVFNAHTGQQLLKLTASDAAAGDLFGHSVAVSGNQAIIGSLKYRIYGNTSGAAYLFDLTSGDELLKFISPETGADDWFGSCVAISEVAAIIGAFRSDDDSGAAYVIQIVPEPAGINMLILGAAILLCVTTLSHLNFDAGGARFAAGCASLFKAPTS